MRLWLFTIDRVVPFDRMNGEEPDPALLPFAIRAAVELSDRTGTLGVRDDERVKWLAHVFKVYPVTVRAAWIKASSEANAYRAKVEAAALRKFREGTEGTMRLGRRAKGHELSKLLNLTEARKRAIFTRPRWIEDGRIVVGKRPKTGLPDYVPESETASNAAAPVVAWTVSKDERRHLIDRLGYRPDTIRRNRINLPEDEFWSRVAKREAETLPADQLAGRKLPGESDWHASRRIKAETPKTRKRAIGVTGARRRFAKAHDIGMTKAKEVTKGLSTEAILAKIPTQSVTPATRYGCHARPDKNGVNPAFPPKFLRHEVSGEGHGSDPIFEGVTDLDHLDLVILRHWFICTRGKPLKADTIRQWRHRRKLDTNLSEACEFMVKEEDWPSSVTGHAEARIEAYREKLRSEANDSRIKAALRGNLSEIKAA